MEYQTSELFEELKKIGFSINEAKVYITLLKIGSGMAGKISKECVLDRTSVYNALSLLLKRGIVSYVIEANRKVFRAENPKKIVDYYKEKEELSKQLIPRLDFLYNSKEQKQDLKLYQGFKGLKTIYQMVLDSCDERNEYLVIGSEGQFSRIMPEYSELFRNQKVKKKIRTRVLRRIKPKVFSKFTKYRKVPLDIESYSTINIFGDKVAIFLWKDKPEAILIESESFAKTYRNYFNFMWRHSKEFS